MATATIRIKKGTTEEWIESRRVLDDGELGIEITENGHRVIRIGDGITEFMKLPVSFDIEEIREIKEEIEKTAKIYYREMADKGAKLIAEMKTVAETIELVDDTTGIKYRMGISDGALYFEETKKETVVPDAGDGTEGEDTGDGYEESEGESAGNTEQEVTE